MTNSHSQKGFSLLELAIVILIGATIAIGLLTLGNVQYERTKIDRTNARLDAIETAILAYATSQKKLPCPAHYNSELNSATYGISEDCSATSVPAGSGMVSSGTGNEEVWRGAVPVRSLNLDDRFMVDGWNNRISYAVVKATSSSNLINYSTTATNGVITIEDWSGNQVTEPDINIVIGYVLISHGKDGAGSYSKVVTTSNTSPNTACVTSSLDNENCDADSSTNSTYRDIRINDSSNISDFYFDIVRWKPLHFLVQLEVNP